MTKSKRQVFSKEEKYRRHLLAVKKWQDKTYPERYLKWRIWIDEVKSNPCYDCHQLFPPECMDFDHVRGEKTFNIGLATWVNKTKILLEIEKCDLVCANCHRIRTRKRQNGINP